MSSAATATATRHRLRLGGATLKVLKDAAERALNVPAARNARATSGRAAAAAALVGRRTRAVKLRTNACRVVVERPVDLTPQQRGGGLVKKKKRSGRVRRLAGSRSRDPLSYRSLSAARPSSNLPLLPTSTATVALTRCADTRRDSQSNWPNTREARQRVDARTMQLRAMGLPPGLNRAHRVSTASGRYVARTGCGSLDTVDGEAPYVPESEPERLAFLEVRRAIGEAAGVDPSRVLPPALAVCMSNGPPLDARCARLWWRRRRARDNAEVCVALEVTPAPLLRPTLEARGGIAAEVMTAGDALIIGGEAWQAPGDGDFTVSMHASISTMALLESRARAEPSQAALVRVT